MSKRISFASMMLAIWALVLAVCLLLTPAALAHHKPGHDQGKKAKSSSSNLLLVAGGLRLMRARGGRAT